MARESSRDREELTDKDKRRAPFLLVSNDHKRRLNYGHISEKYSIFVLKTCILR